MYEALLGDAWWRLHPAIRRFHEGGTLRRASGTFRVRHGSNVIARLVSFLGGMPPATDATPIHLVIRPDTDGSGAEPYGVEREEWRRSFGSAPLVSVQSIDGGSIVERFGAVEVRFRLAVTGDALRYDFESASLRRWILSIPFPLTASASECARSDGGIEVSVDVALRGIGRIIAYDGTLTRIEVDR